MSTLEIMHVIVFPLLLCLPERLKFRPQEVIDFNNVHLFHYCAECVQCSLWWWAACAMFLFLLTNVEISLFSCFVWFLKITENVWKCKFSKSTKDLDKIAYILPLLWIRISFFHAQSLFLFYFYVVPETRYQSSLTSHFPRIETASSWYF